jgi:hypothetical protein
MTQPNTAYRKPALQRQQPLSKVTADAAKSISSKIFRPVS